MRVQINGSEVRTLRAKMGWTQEHLAQLVDRSARTIQRVENSGNCDLETRSALASVFDVSSDRLERQSSSREAALADEYPIAPSIPISSGSFFAYANAHPRPLDLIHTIAKRRHLEVRNIDSESACLNEQVSALGIETVRELDELVRKHAGVASRLCDYLLPTGPVDTGFILSRVLEVTAIDRGGKDGIARFYESLRYSSGGAGRGEEMFKYYEEIQAFG